MLTITPRILVICWLGVAAVSSISAATGFTSWASAGQGMVYAAMPVVGAIVGSIPRRRQ